MEEEFRYWGEDLKEDEEILNAILDYTLKDWLSPEEDEAWKDL